MLYDEPGHHDTVDLASSGDGRVGIAWITEVETLLTNVVFVAFDGNVANPVMPESILITNPRFSFCYQRSRAAREVSASRSQVRSTVRSACSSRPSRLMWTLLTSIVLLFAASCSEPTYDLIELTDGQDNARRWSIAFDGTDYAVVWTTSANRPTTIGCGRARVPAGDFVTAPTAVLEIVTRRESCIWSRPGRPTSCGFARTSPARRPFARSRSTNRVTRSRPRCRSGPHTGRRRRSAWRGRAAGSPCSVADSLPAIRSVPIQGIARARRARQLDRRDQRDHADRAEARVVAERRDVRRRVDRGARSVSPGSQPTEP